MLKETKKLYERCGPKARIPAKALKLLKEKGLLTPYKGVPYTIGNIYAVTNERYDDRQVEEAIVIACKEYLEESAQQKSDLKELIQA